MHEIRIATRGSALAVAQARRVADLLVGAAPGVATRLVEVATTGDRDRTTPVAELTEVGAFVRAVQQAVLDGRADVAVHSAKDLPVAGPPELRIVFPEREAPWDVLVGGTPDTLRPGARVGTGSPRRRAQLLALRPDLEVVDVRGNVETRIGKVRSGELDAVVLAEAGLRRLGATEAISHRFTLEEMVPAPAQAALAVEARDGDAVVDLMFAIEDAATARAVAAEREVLARTGAGCRSALGVLAEPSGSGLEITGFVLDERGARRGVGSGSSAACVAGVIAALELG